MDISFTTTAVCRPDIIDLTYNSFNNKLHGVSLKNCCLFLNVDPIPEDVDPIKVVDIARKYFGEVIYNIPKIPNFSAAVDWCWKSAISDYIFHLEDDWVLLSDFDCVGIIDKQMNKNVKQIVLRAYDYHYDKMVLSPSIIKKELYKSFVGKFDYNLNPEIQLRTEWVNKLHIAVSGRKKIVKDIGRDWIKKTKYKKPNKKSEFYKWI